MATLAEFRQQYPQYGDMPDGALADALYRKFYSDLPRAEFDAKVGLSGGEAQPNAFVDAAKSLGSGIARGAAGVLGLPGDAQAGMSGLAGFVADRLFGEATPDQREQITAIQEASRIFPTSEEIKQTATDITGVTLPTPQTTAGRYAHTVGEFLPAAAGGPGGFFGRLLKYGVAPGMASEAAGQAFEGTAAEPWARAGAAVATGGLAALASRPSTPMAALRSVAPRALNQQDITAARALIAEGQSRGVPLTWPEALAQVTGRRVDMTDVQRVLEQSPGGRPVMSEFMSRRPQQTAAAMDAELGTMGPQMSPVRTGLDIQRVSQKALDGLRTRINVITRPLYEAAGPVNVNPARFTALSRDPLFQAAVRDIRNDPVYSRSVANSSDMSVAMFDAIKKRLDDLTGAARAGGRNYEASVTGGLARDVRTEAQAASPEYAQALDLQSRYRRGVLDPAETGPLGQMASTPDLRAQSNALLPSNPLAGSERTVAQTVRRLVRNDPQAATQLVRTHLASAFDEAIQANVGGANQWGAAKAAAGIIGNRQQERNLQAAIEALPAGQLRWRGFKSLMEVFQATGVRQRPNSATEFNRQIQADMGRGGAIGTGASLAMSPSSALTYVRDFYTRFRLGQNTEALARIITEPGNEALFARLLGAKTLVDKQAAAAVILYQAQEQIRQPAPQLTAR